MCVCVCAQSCWRLYHHISGSGRGSGEVPQGDEQGQLEVPECDGSPIEPIGGRMDEFTLTLPCVSPAQPKPERHHDQSGSAAAAEVSEPDEVFSQTFLRFKARVTSLTLPPTAERVKLRQLRQEMMPTGKCLLHLQLHLSDSLTQQVGIGMFANSFLEIGTLKVSDT